jgi:site-specific recombinase XerD
MGKAFNRYLKELELDKKGYNLRTFRKSFATNAFEKDISLVSAAALLEHKNISTTMKYNNKANRKKLAEELKKLI